jgi:phosphatidylglycerophosphate synthase
VSDVTDDADRRLAAAVKDDDGFFTTFFVSSYSPHLVRAAARLRLRPDVVTVGALVGGLCAAAAFALGSRADLITGAVLLQLSFTLDVVDGQLARFTGTSSAFGAWFDSMADRTKEFVVYAGLAIGSVRAFHHDVWALAGVALVIQVSRQQLDLSYRAGRSGVAPAAVDAGRSAQLGRTAIRLSASTDRRAWTYWPKRILVLPIGERMLLISVSAAAFRPDVTFIALSAWGGVALAYIATGRIVRSFAAGPISGGSEVLRTYRDDGPLRALRPASFGRASALVLALVGVAPWFVMLSLATRGGSVAALAVALAWLLGWGTASGRALPVGRLDWLVPPIVQAAEYIGVLRLAALSSDHDVAAGYALAGVIAFRHYDLVYRPAASAVSRVASVVTGGWGLRLVVALGLAAAGVVDPGYYALAAALAMVLLGESVAAWHDPKSRRAVPSVAADEELH